MTAVIEAPVEAAAERDAFIERFLGSLTETMNVFAIYLGDRLGLYEALAPGCPLTSRDLARRAQVHERYAREWLEQQTLAGILRVENPQAASTERRFRLPSGLAEALTDRESLNYVAPLAQLVVGCTRPIDQLAEAFRTGGGVPFAAYGKDLREGQARANRAAFLYELAQSWIPAMPDVHGRLTTGRGVRIADIGCGYGWSSIGMARGFPHARVDGFDLDGPSIELARANAREYGVEERVRFVAGDAAQAAGAGEYALVTALECIHDLSDPVAVLRTMRSLAGAEGAVLIMDERVCDCFTPEGNEVEPLMYGFSVLHCLPAAMVDQPSAATGTVMRAGTLREYASEAGFRRVEVLPIDNFFFRFYRLHA